MKLINELEELREDLQSDSDYKNKYKNQYPVEFVAWCRGRAIGAELAIEIVKKHIEELECPKSLITEDLEKTASKYCMYTDGMFHSLVAKGKTTKEEDFLIELFNDQERRLCDMFGDMLQKWRTLK